MEIKVGDIYRFYLETHAYHTVIGFTKRSILDVNSETIVHFIAVRFNSEEDTYYFDSELNKFVDNMRYLRWRKVEFKDLRHLIH
jgi:hypothetical protein